MIAAILGRPIENVLKRELLPGTEQCKLESPAPPKKKNRQPPGPPPETIVKSKSNDLGPEEKPQQKAFFAGRTAYKEFHEQIRSASKGKGDGKSKFKADKSKGKGDGKSKFKADKSKGKGDGKAKSWSSGKSSDWNESWSSGMYGSKDGKTWGQEQGKGYGAKGKAAPASGKGKKKNKSSKHTELLEAPIHENRRRINKLTKESDFVSAVQELVLALHDVNMTRERLEDEWLWVMILRASCRERSINATRARIAFPTNFKDLSSEDALRAAGIIDEVADWKSIFNSLAGIWNLPSITKQSSKCLQAPVTTNGIEGLFGFRTEVEIHGQLIQGDPAVTLGGAGQSVAKKAMERYFPKEYAICLAGLERDPTNFRGIKSLRNEIDRQNKLREAESNKEEVGENREYERDERDDEEHGVENEETLTGYDAEDHMDLSSREDSDNPLCDMYEDNENTQYAPYLSDMYEDNENTQCAAYDSSDDEHAKLSSADLQDVLE